MRILGLVFAGTSTARRPEMARFLRETLGLEQVRVGGIDADVFEFPDGARFVVADPGGMGQTSRSVGFLIESLDEAMLELRAVGVEVGDEPGENELQRYVHFRAPDGELYELIEERR
ncbi:MAG TPA: VOC family protein [Gaiellaceae bacterium]|nr:VOC family protein [Gaiellaceae bacterium]